MEEDSGRGNARQPVLVSLLGGYCLRSRENKAGPEQQGTERLEVEGRAGCEEEHISLSFHLLRINRKRGSSVVSTPGKSSPHTFCTSECLRPVDSFLGGGPPVRTMESKGSIAEGTSGPTVQPCLRDRE